MWTQNRLRTGGVELSDPMKKAKEAIDTQAASIGQIQNSDPAGMVAAYQQKSVFWLAAEILQMYLNEEITANFPPDAPNEISYEMIGNYLDDSVVLTEGASAFPEDTYRKMITLLALTSWMRAELSRRQERSLRRRMAFPQSRSMPITTFPKI